MLLSVIRYLHQKRILHRDVKPQNILIDSEGRAKLCDFGFARNLGMETFVLTSIKGTPLYMAPEVIEGKPYDHSVDLWSVGCILYELCVGKTPFSSTDLPKLINRVRYDSVQWPREMSGVCRSFLQGLLEKDCHRRMSWIEIINHPFVAEFFALNPPSHGEQEEVLGNPLTEPMTESQELAKEIQRQDKAKQLAAAQAAKGVQQQPLIQMVKKYEENKRRWKEAQAQAMLVQQGVPNMVHNHNRGRRASDTNLGIPHQFKAQEAHARGRRFSDQPQYTPARAQVEPFMGVQPKQIFHPQKEVSVPVASKKIPDHKETQDALVEQVVKATESLNIAGVELEDKPFENIEWCQFLDSQIIQICNDQKVLDNQNYIDIVTRPLKNVNASLEVLNKTLGVLALPLTLDDIEPALCESILKGYKEVGVVSCLVLACRRLVDSNESKDEVVDNLRKLTCMLCRLVLIQDCFAKQVEAAFKASQDNLVEKLVFVDDKVRYYTLAVISKLFENNVFLVFDVESTLIKCLDNKNSFHDICYILYAMLKEGKKVPIVKKIVNESNFKNLWIDEVPKSVPKEIVEQIKPLMTS